MARSQIDPEKIRVFIRSLRKDDLAHLLDRAIDFVPRTKLPKLVDGLADPGQFQPEDSSARDLLEAVSRFQAASERGDYYDGFDVNSKNFMEMSRGTETWIAECERLYDRCVEQVSRGGYAEMREALEILFGLLRRIDEGTDDILFFADEGGSWLVVVAWEKVLPAWFESLVPATNPEEYAEAVVGVIDEFDDSHRNKHLREARRVASPAQKKALRGA